MLRNVELTRFSTGRDSVKQLITNMMLSIENDNAKSAGKTKNESPTDDDMVCDPLIGVNELTS